jgi:hypothetical protein
MDTIEFTTKLTDALKMQEKLLLSGGENITPQNETYRSNLSATEVVAKTVLI